MTINCYYNNLRLKNKSKQGLPDDGSVELADSFMADPDYLASLQVSLPAQSPPVVTPVASAASSFAKERGSKISMSQEQVNIERKHDLLLVPCCDAVLPADEMNELPTCTNINLNLCPMQTPSLSL